MSLMTQVRTALYSVKDTDPFLVFFSVTVSAWVYKGVILTPVPGHDLLREVSPRGTTRCQGSCRST